MADSNRRTIFVIVSGLKPESDEGGNILDARKLEGARQTFPFENISLILRNLQETFSEIQIVPISVQYGDPRLLKDLFAQLSKEFGLSNAGIILPDCVDWSDDFLAQACFMQALCSFNCNQGFPPLAVGNASTYGHLLLALNSWHFNNGKMFIAHDSFPGEVRVKNRAYWRELSQFQLGGVNVVPQPENNPGNWEQVAQQLSALLIQEISRHI